MLDLSFSPKGYLLLFDVLRNILNVGHIQQVVIKKYNSCFIVFLNHESSQHITFDSGVLCGTGFIMDNRHYRDSTNVPT